MFLKNYCYQRKTIMFFERLKKIKNLADKLNIIINIINIIVGFCVATKLDAFKSDVIAEPNVFKS